MMVTFKVRQLSYISQHINVCLGGDGGNTVHISQWFVPLKTILAIREKSTFFNFQ